MSVVENVIAMRDKSKSSVAGNVLSGLSQEAYTSEAFFQAEQERVFARN